MLRVTRTSSCGPEVVEMTGPDALGFAEAAEILNRVAGLSVRYEPGAAPGRGDAAGFGSRRRVDRTPP